MSLEKWDDRLESVFSALLVKSFFIYLFPCCPSFLGQSPKIMAIPLAEKHKIIRIGLPVILQCQVLDNAAQVSWFKDRMELFSKTGLDMKRDGNLRKLIIHSAKTSDAGLYSCSLADDVVTFHVDIEGELLAFIFKSKNIWSSIYISTNSCMLF